VRFIDLPKLVQENELISSDKYKYFCSKRSQYVYIHRDFLFRSGNWRGKHIKKLISQRSEFENKSIVVGHSDKTTNLLNSHVFIQMGAKAFFGINTYALGNRIHSLPLGLTNDCDDSPIHRILGNERHFLQADQHSHYREDFDGSIYANFTIKNNSRERLPLMKILSELKMVSVGELVISERGRIDYLMNLRRHSLVPCPEGNGIDTHRIWETLYMGGTPVIKRSKYLQPLLVDLPVIFVNQWSEITDRKIMEQKWYALSESHLALNNLKLSFWTRKIESSVE